MISRGKFPRLIAFVEAFLDRVYNKTNHTGKDKHMATFDILGRIRELCQERGWSYYQLSKASGLTYSTINTLFNKRSLPSLTTLDKICAGFGISLSEFFDSGKEHSDLTSAQRECLVLFSSLSPEDKQLALAYLKGLSKKL